jgi:hypothetical protein
MIINPVEFKRTGINFLRTGRYTDAPYESRDWWEFWEEEEKRCLGGYTVGGVTIPGKYYFFLNFFPIMRAPSKDDILYNRVAASQTKVLSFADFWEIQQKWFVEKEIAFRRPFGQGNHMICFKTRGCGWSYMDAAESVYNYNFIRKSKNFYLAFLEAYLLGKDGVLWKCWDGLDHLNQHTQGFWLKNRHEKDTDMFKRASFFERGHKYAKGYKSEISGLVIDDPRKVRGCRGIKVSLEEIGSFKNFVAVIEALRPLVEEPPYIHGQISAFGTGGEEGAYIEGAQKVFENPSEFNFASFDHDYDDDALSDTIGYFVPADVTTFFSEDGKPKREEARLYWEGEYAKKKDPEARSRLQAERPLIPAHIFRRQAYSIFDKDLAAAQQKRIRTDPSIKNLIRHGTLVPAEAGWKFIETNAKPLIFPHKNVDNLDGCITVIIPPIKSESEVGRYGVFVDPYYKEDQPEEVISIGSIYVVDFEMDMIVAWYAGRPRTKDQFHFKIFSLAEWYGAKIQSEIAGGGQEIVTYAKIKRKLHMLEYESEMHHNKELASHSKNRSYFMSMTTDRKRTGLMYFADWTLRQRGIKEDGLTYTLNYDKVYDEWLLEEIVRYRDGKNFDRISCMVIGMFMIKEKVYIMEMERRTENKDSFFNRPIFTDSTTSHQSSFKSNYYI